MTCHRPGNGWGVSRWVWTPVWKQTLMVGTLEVAGSLREPLLTRAAVLGKGTLAWCWAETGAHGRQGQEVVSEFILWGQH